MKEKLNPKKITDFSKPMPTFVHRTVSPLKAENACNAVIDLLRKQLKLQPYECYFVIENLYKSFPKEDLI